MERVYQECDVIRAAVCRAFDTAAADIARAFNSPEMRELIRRLNGHQRYVRRYRNRARKEAR
jgi:hypothetical protein